jgi:hypothetical protein
MKNIWDNTQIARITILPEKQVSVFYNIETEEQKTERLDYEKRMSKAIETMCKMREQYKLKQRV